MVKATANALATARNFPTALAEQESVSEHSPGPVDDGEILVRTLFREEQIDSDGRLNPCTFTPSPRPGVSPLTVCPIASPESLASSKKSDARYNGFLKFIATRSRDVRALSLANGKRLFCVYDTATAENNAHADICQNVHVASGAQNRKKLMMEIAWQLRSAFRSPQPVPPTS